VVIGRCVRITSSKPRAQLMGMALILTGLDSAYKECKKSWVQYMSIHDVAMLLTFHRWTR
jgi:hypothetical protein